MINHRLFVVQVVMQSLLYAWFRSHAPLLHSRQMPGHGAVHTGLLECAMMQWVQWVLVDYRCLGGCHQDDHASSQAGQ